MSTKTTTTSKSNHSFKNPAQLHDAVAWGYSHTASIKAGAECILVSGQYGSDDQGQLKSTDFADQVQNTFANIGTALAAHGLDMSSVAQLRTYVVGLDFEKMGIITGAIKENWGDAPPVQTLLGVAGLAMPDMAFEVEVMAVRS